MEDEEKRADGQDNFLLLVNSKALAQGSDHVDQVKITITLIQELESAFTSYL